MAWSNQNHKVYWNILINASHYQRQRFWRQIWTIWHLRIILLLKQMREWKKLILEIRKEWKYVIKLTNLWGIIINLFSRVLILTRICRISLISWRKGERTRPETWRRWRPDIPLKTTFQDRRFRFWGRKRNCNLWFLRCWVRINFKGLRVN